MTFEPRILRTEAEETLLGQIDGGAGVLPAAQRKEAADRFARSGLPHRRIEEWHYTDLRALLRNVPPLAAGRSDEAALKSLLAADPLGAFDRARIVIADGVFRPDLSDLAGLDGIAVRSVEKGAARVGALARAGNPAVDLNAALASGGVSVSIPDGVLVARPIELLHLATRPVSIHVRNVLTVGKGASMRVAETFRGADHVYFTNAVTELDAGAEATILWAKFEDEAAGATHLDNLFARLNAKVSLRHLLVTRGAALSRSEKQIRIAGGADARLSLAGATMLSGGQHADITLTIEHEMPGSESRVLFKNVVGGEAHGAFQGKIVVHKDAQKTDGKMMSQTLLLSDEASFAMKPELEIYADDVQCGHGATSGEIDEDLLFYFLSRGIPLILAFLSEAVETLGDEAMVEAFRPVVEGWLERRSNGGAS